MTLHSMKFKPATEAGVTAFNLLAPMGRGPSAATLSLLGTQWVEIAKRQDATVQSAIPVSATAASIDNALPSFQRDNSVRALPATKSATRYSSLGAALARYSSLGAALAASAKMKQQRLLGLTEILERYSAITATKSLVSAPLSPNGATSPRSSAAVVNEAPLTLAEILARHVPGRVTNASSLAVPASLAVFANQLPSSPAPAEPASPGSVSTPFGSPVNLDWSVWQGQPPASGFGRGKATKVVHHLAGGGKLCCSYISETFPTLHLLGPIEVFTLLSAGTEFLASLQKKDATFTEKFLKGLIAGADGAAILDMVFGWNLGTQIKLITLALRLGDHCYEAWSDSGSLHQGTAAITNS